MESLGQSADREVASAVPGTVLSGMGYAARPAGRCTGGVGVSAVVPPGRTESLRKAVVVAPETPLAGFAPRLGADQGRTRASVIGRIGFALAISYSSPFLGPRVSTSATTSWPPGDSPHARIWCFVASPGACLRPTAGIAGAGTAGRGVLPDILHRECSLGGVEGK